ncbi:hypothetical protein ACFSTC_13440 [Nonomuraea ferruginea]
MDVHGPDQLIETLRQGHEPFDDVTITLDVGPLADGDHVAARWTFAGAYRGGMPGATAAPPAPGSPSAATTSCAPRTAGSPSTGSSPTSSRSPASSGRADTPRSW